MFSWQYIQYYSHPDKFVYDVIKLHWLFPKCIYEELKHFM